MPRNFVSRFGIGAGVNSIMREQVFEQFTVTMFGYLDFDIGTSLLADNLCTSPDASGTAECYP